MRAGRNVIVFPEATRGTDYRLRPFKKGPFVLAIASGAPVVPTIGARHDSREPRGSLRARSGEVDVHFLEPIPTAGLGYADRDRLARAGLGADGRGARGAVRRPQPAPGGPRRGQRGLAAARRPSGGGPRE
jgi:1-acyl-sn-glycerol-3-phosphate acyltransferase